MSERKRSKLSLNKNANKVKQDEYRLILITPPPLPVSQEPMLISWWEKNRNEEEWGALNMEDLLQMTIREIKNYLSHDKPPPPSAPIIITIEECPASNKPSGEESIKKAASDFLQKIRNLKQIM